MPLFETVEKFCVPVKFKWTSASNHCGHCFALAAAADCCHQIKFIGSELNNIRWKAVA